MPEDFFSKISDFKIPEVNKCKDSDLSKSFRILGLISKKQKLTKSLIIPKKKKNRSQTKK